MYSNIYEELTYPPPSPLRLFTPIVDSSVNDLSEYFEEKKIFQSKLMI